MATRRSLTNRFKDEYAKATKKEKKLILDRLVEVGMGRSTARRLLREPARPAGKGRLRCFASMFVRQVRQCFSAVWADGFPRCRHRFPVM